MQVLSLVFITVILIILIRLLFRKFLDFPAYTGQLLADHSGIENLMEEDKFWHIIQEVRNQSRRNYMWQCELLTEHLESLPEQDIIQFDRTFTVLMARSYTYRLWEPAYALNGGCSDDAFEYFRSWLIGQGKNKFYWTLKHPRLLFLVGVKEMLENYEGLAYCAYQAYLNKTGRDIPQRDDIQYADAGQVFKEGEAFLRYPELALLAW